MKKLFNFYLDDNMKEAATAKLEALMGKTEKGALASLIRVMLRNFLMNNDVDMSLITEVAEEYEYSQRRKTRSRM